MTRWLRDRHRDSGYTVSGPTLEGEVERSDLSAAINRLDETKRDLLALRFACDLTIAEIAEVTHKSPQSIYKQLSRAFTELRGYLDE
jgi:RNA polymerase sigma factor (sigma-70 family)